MLEASIPEILKRIECFGRLHSMTISKRWQRKAVMGGLKE